MNHFIHIRQLRLYAYHGVMPQERKVGAWFTIDLTLRTDFSLALERDELGGTVSYADVYELVRREMQTPSRLLEHVGGRICRSVFRSFPAVEAVSLRLMKDTPPVGANCGGMGIEIEMERKEINDQHD